MKPSLPPRPVLTAHVPGITLRCVYCHDGLEAREAVHCSACLAPHHADCFHEHAKCAAPGCAETSFVRRETVARVGRRVAVLALALSVVALPLGGMTVRVVLERDVLNSEELRAERDAALRRCEIANGQVERLTRLKGSLEKDLADIRQSYADQRKSLKEQSLVLAMLEEGGLKVEPLFLAPPVPAIDAKVVAVKVDVNPPLALLSVGSDDKVEKGFHFSVYRGSEFVGKVVVEKVLKDSCGCRVLFTKEGATIRAGDSAATRLQ